MRLPKLLICGPHLCGKDQSCLWLSQNTPYRFRGTTSFFLKKYVAEKQGVTEEVAYATRHQHSMLWKRLGDELRETDPGVLMRDALEGADITGGIRSHHEVDYARRERLFDLILWIDRPGLDNDPTIEFNASDCDLVVPNTADLSALYGRWAVLCRALGVPVTGSW